MRLVVEQRANRRREKLPTSDKVTVIIPNKFTSGSRRDIILTVRDPARNGPYLIYIYVTYAAYIPLYYVLLFPYGDYE